MAYQSEIEKLERLYGDKPEQYFAALGEAYRKSGKLEEAIELVRAGLERRPDYVSAQIVLGRCLLDKEDDDEATGVFRKVLEFDAENIIALSSLTKIAEKQGDVGSAREWLNRLLEVDPMNTEARETLERLGAAEQPVAEAAEEATAGPGVEATAVDQPAVTLDATGSPIGSQPSATEAAPSVPDEPAVTSFDEELGWGAGQRTSKQISQQDLRRAETLHEESIAPPSDQLVDLDTTAPVEAPEVPATADSVEPAAVVPDEPATIPPLAHEAETPPEPAGTIGETVPVASAEPGETVAPPEVPEVPATADLGEPAEVVVEEPSMVELSVEETETPLEPAATVEDEPSRSPGGDLELILPETGLEEREVVGAVEPEPVVTETMAEVYAKQGLFEEAREVYQKLLEDQPGDAALEARIAELSPRVQEREAAETAKAPQYRAAAVGGASVRSFLTEVLAARPPRSEESIRPATEPSALEAAFGQEEDEGAETATGAAGEDVSLSAVFGDESSVAAPEPTQGQSAAPGAGEPSGPSFDQFFGSKPKSAQPAEEQPPSDPSESGDSSLDDFQNWLKTLKS